jgi:hypothetical protein
MLKVPTPLSSKLKKAIRLKPRSESVWAGPCGKGPNGGITQGLLSRFLVCRERFRLAAVEGLQPVDSFNHKLEYGQMWHTCEESLANGDGEVKVTDHGKLKPVWEARLQAYCKTLCQRYRTQQEQIQHWYNACKVQFPVYVSYWAKHPDVKQRTPILQEQVFNAPYALPSGRIVRLRGKWDSVDLIGKGKGAGVYLQENKTKGDIKEEQLKRQLSSGFDLQTMLYLVALNQESYGGPLRGVRYNVIRRPLSGGKGSIVQGKGTQGSKCSKCKETGILKDGTACPKCDGVGRIGGKPPETDEEFFGRLGTILREEPEYWFMRWKVEVSQTDIERFKVQCLNPILEQLCDWWEWISTDSRGDPWRECCTGQHFRYPYGIYNVLQEGGSAEMDEYLNTGSELGLARTKTLFRELAEGTYRCRNQFSASRV